MLRQRWRQQRLAQCVQRLDLPVKLKEALRTLLPVFGSVNRSRFAIAGSIAGRERLDRICPRTRHCRPGA